MSLNTTQITGPANSSLSYAASPISAQGRSQVIDPANNLGYGMGRIVRSAFDHLWHTWQKMWAVEPISEELALKSTRMIFRNGLRECVQRLNAALEDVRKNPLTSGALKKIESLADALYLKFQERPELRALQHQALQPLEEKISQLDPQIKNALRQLLPLLFQEKSSVEETPVAKDTGPLLLADSRIAKTKRAVQQTGAFAASLDLSTLMGTDGFKVDGLAGGDSLGWSVSTAGDVNGDGKADLVLGAPDASPGGRRQAGTAYVVFGQASGWPGALNLTTLNGIDGFKVEGLVLGDQLGSSVSLAGDLNGDGKADLVLGVLGAYNASLLGRNQAGTAYVVFGQASGWPGIFDLTTLNGINGFKVEGLVGQGWLGTSVSTAGDVNGDGKADLVLGAPHVSSGLNDQAGTAYVVFGQASGWPGAFDLATLNGTNGFKVEGLAAFNRLGISVSTAGDINGDGTADLVLGAPGASPGGRISAGTAYVLFGQASGWPGALNLATLNGTNGFKVEDLGLAANDYLGYSVSTAGDINGDGKADLVLGAPNASPGGRNFAGTAYVVFGQASGWPGAFDLTTLNGTNGFKVEGLAANDWLGWSVSTAGDVNSDGKADLVLGAPHASPRGSNSAGTAYVVFGQASGWPGAFNLTTLNGTNGFKVEGLGLAANDYLGYSVSTAGDVNGDGLFDLLLGAPGSSPNGTVYVIFGRNTSLAPPPSMATPTLSPTSGPSSGFASSALPSTAIPTLSPTSGPSSGFASSTPSSIATQGPTSSLTSGISPTPITSTSQVPTPANGVGGPTPSGGTIGIAAGVVVLGGLAGLYD